MIRLFSGFAVVTVALSLGGCGGLGGLYGNDEMERYSQRLDTITASAGDAKEVNRATQTNNPWPAYVGDRRIPANGERMTRAVERYQRGQPGIPSTPTTGIGAGVGAGAGGGAGTSGTPGGGTTPY